MPVEGGLGTLDKSGKRLFVYPLEQDGRFRKARDIIYWFLIAIFLYLPWVTRNGQQWVLFNIPDRQFTIFGFQFWAHDAPMLFFIFGGFALSLMFVTSLYGRIWCGWACPQTVFIDGVYRRIERWIEGRANIRKKLDAAPWTVEKFRKRFLKHAAYIIVTMIVTHSFLAYFVGSREVLKMMTQSPAENWFNFVFVWAITGILYFNFAWFREQFCIIMCPYGRLQSALFDRHSMIVGYDEARKDCIECKRCVNVCPTGIDIRNGVQMECIACTACIDACDEIMDKVKKPRGLIRYTTEAELEGKQTKRLRPRTFAYAFIILALCTAFVTVLARRKPIEYTLLRSELMPKEVSSANSIFHYAIEVSNQSFVPKKVELSIQTDQAELVIPQNPLLVRAGKVKKLDFFLKMKSNSSELPNFPVELRIVGDSSPPIVLPLKQ